MPPNLKKLIFSAAIFFASFALVGGSAVAQSETGALGADDAYKAVVKITTYMQNEDYKLTKVSSGSGVIISEGGLILTNDHLASLKSSLDNSPFDTTYLVCLTSDINDSPNCNYVAKLVSADEDLDLAILQIINIPGISSDATYPYLSIDDTDSGNSGDTVTVLGYPSIGGSSLTVSKGILSGKVTEDGQKWLKTDAVTSFGSSGGAVLNDTGKLIGMPTAVASNYSASLGYAINMATAEPWLTSHRGENALDSALVDQLIQHVTMATDAIQSNVYQNSYPKFNITKPNSWSYSLPDQTELFISNTTNKNGGYVDIVTIKFAYPVNIKNVIPYIKYEMLLKGNLQYFNINSEENVNINGLPAKKLVTTADSGEENFYALPLGNNLVLMSYSYGQDDVDKDSVESIIRSLTSNAAPERVGPKTYKNNANGFSFSVNGDWYILPKALPASPLVIQNSKYPDLFVKVDMSKFSASRSKKIDNNLMLKNYKELFNKINQIASVIDLKYVITYSNAHQKINKKVLDGVQVNVDIKTPSDGKTIARKINYAKRLKNNYAIDISMFTLTGDKKTFTKYKSEFDKMLQKFIIN